MPGTLQDRNSPLLSLSCVEAMHLRAGLQSGDCFRYHNSLPGHSLTLPLRSALQPLHAGSDSPTRGGQAEAGGYDVQSTYFPAASQGYAPPASSHGDPFAQATDNGYSGGPASSSGLAPDPHQHVPEVVPAAMPGHAVTGDTVLHFQGPARFPVCITPRLALLRSGHFSCMHMGETVLHRRACHA